MTAPVKNPAKNLLKNFQTSFLKVNLLISKEEQLKLPARLIKWILSSGRFIVIFVEIVTIGAFVLRYKLDAELLDIQDQINDQIPYIQSLKQNEMVIRQTQLQLSTIHQIKNNNPNYAAIFAHIAALTPYNTKLTSIALDRAQSFPKTTLTISGQTPSNLEISTLVKTLQKDPFFAEVTLSNISFEGQVTFTITGSLSEKGAQSS